MHRSIGLPRRIAIHPATADTVFLLSCAQIASSDSCEFHAAAADGSDDVDGRSPRPKPTAPADSAGRATGSVVTQITLDSDSDDDGAADSGGGTGGRVSQIGSSSILSSVSLSVSGAAASGSSRRESERCDISDDGSMAGDGGASPPAAPQPVVWC